jgi:hypothetical protein
VEEPRAEDGDEHGVVPRADGLPVARALHQVRGEALPFVGAAGERVLVARILRRGHGRDLLLGRRAPAQGHEGDEGDDAEDQRDEADDENLGFRARQAGSGAAEEHPDQPGEEALEGGLQGLPEIRGELPHPFEEVVGHAGLMQAGPARRPALRGVVGLLLVPQLLQQRGVRSGFRGSRDRVERFRHRAERRRGHLRGGKILGVGDRRKDRAVGREFHSLVADAQGLEVPRAAAGLVEILPVQRTADRREAVPVLGERDRVRDGQEEEDRGDHRASVRVRKRSRRSSPVSRCVDRWA